MSRPPAHDDPTEVWPQPTTKPLQPAPPRTQSSSSQPRKPPIERLGQYRLEKLLGQGGMAEVYLATREGAGGFEKQVVVKRIRPGLVKSQGKRSVEMFLREAQVLARLDHPNVVQIFELAEDGGEYFMAMEYLEGVSLADLGDRMWAAGETIGIEAIVRVVADAALGLDHAHNLKNEDGSPLNLVHRDVSADNVFVTTAGGGKLIDFGIAKPQGWDGLTRAGEIKGKVPYMSPEQVAGKPLDSRTDLFSLGVVLYWALTGRRPFDGKTDVHTMKNLSSEPLRPMRELNPQMPPILDVIVASCLEKDRDQRMPSGAALHRALATVLASLPPGAVSVTTYLSKALPLPTPTLEIHPQIATIPTVAWPARFELPKSDIPIRPITSDFSPLVDPVFPRASSTPNASQDSSAKSAASQASASAPFVAAPRAQGGRVVPLAPGAFGTRVQSTVTPEKAPLSRETRAAIAAVGIAVAIAVVAVALFSR